MGPRRVPYSVDQIDRRTTGIRTVHKVPKAYPDLRTPVQRTGWAFSCCEVIVQGQCEVPLEMSGQICYSDEFKIDAVAQVTEREYSVKDVAARLGINTKSLYTWMAQFSKPHRHTDREAEVRRLKKALARVTEERDILRKGETIFRHWSEDNGRTRTSPGMQSEVHVHRRASSAAFCPCSLQNAECSSQRLLRLG